MYDIVFIGPADSQWKKIKSKYITAKRADTFLSAKKKAFTKFFWAVSSDLEIADNFNFDYVPDDYSQDVIHVFKNDKHFDGLFLSPRDANPSQRELDHRFFVHKKEVDILASVPLPFDYFEIDSYEDYEYALENSKTQMFWMGSRNIEPSKELIENFYISHHEKIDRTQNHAFKHLTKDGETYNGLFLCTKDRKLSKREVEYRFPVDRKEWDIVGSGPKKYDVFTIETYDDYLEAVNNSTTEMFWALKPSIDTSEFDFDIYFSFENTYDRETNHAFLHNEQGEMLRNSVWLLSKTQPVSKREIEYRFIVNAKEWDVVASKTKLYDQFIVDTYDDYLKALENTSTEMFWAIPSRIKDINEEIFNKVFTYKNMHDKENEYDLNINHVYKNGEYFDGIILCSTTCKISKREFYFGFIVQKKEVDIVASQPKPYDIVFISYNEPNANENFDQLMDQFPDRVIHRVHGIKGIHQAHIEAAKICDTEMVWIVDGDAKIVDGFNFDYQVPAWERTTVHVWRSQNPINKLVYGYGGIKLFPTQLTIDMNVNKPDMTTSISEKFKAVKDVSNITAFNTDPFNTWKSAFRECCKLSSKIIDRQKDDETNERLNIWCTAGEDELYGKYSIEGAKAGAAYGARNKDDVKALKMINDFDWLKEQFDATDI